MPYCPFDPVTLLQFTLASSSQFAICDVVRYGSHICTLLSQPVIKSASFRNTDLENVGPEHCDIYRVLL
jgi:hypothetical protein